MRILMLVDRPPHPPTSGGRMRSDLMLRALSGSHDVSVVCSCARPGDDALLAASQAVYRNADLLPWPVGAREKAQSWIARKFEEDRIDLLHYEELNTVRLLHPRESPVPYVMNAHNVEFVLDRRLAAAYTPLVGANGWRRTLALEMVVMRGASRVFACSEHDASILRGLAPRTDISILPNCIDTEYFAPSREPRHSNVLFLGDLSYSPNVSAVRELALTIMPIVWMKRPDIGLVVVGRNPSEGVRDLPWSPRMRLEHDVPDVRPWLRSCGVLAVPLRAGSGTRIKIIQGVAVGIPVVSTTIGIEGLEDIRPLALIADSADGFAAGLLDVLARPQALRPTARDVVVAGYGLRRWAEAVRETYPRDDEVRSRSGAFVDGKVRVANAEPDDSGGPSRAPC